MHTRRMTRAGIVRNLSLELESDDLKYLVFTRTTTLIPPMLPFLHFTGPILH